MCIRDSQYGIHGSASWNGFSLSFLLQGVGKRDLWVMNDLFYPHYDAWTTVYDSQLNYWTPENTNSYFPRIYEKAAGNTDANTRVQTRYLQEMCIRDRDFPLSKHALPREYHQI